MGGHELSVETHLSVTGAELKRHILAAVNQNDLINIKNIKLITSGRVIDDDVSLQQQQQQQIRVCLLLITVALYGQVVHTHTYMFLSGCKEVEHCTSQPSWNSQLPTTSQHHSTTQISLRNCTNVRIHAHTAPAHTSPARTCTLTIELIFSIYIIGCLSIYLRGPSCEKVGNWTLQPPTTSQHHVLAQIRLHNYMNVNTHTHACVCLRHSGDLQTWPWDVQLSCNEFGQRVHTHLPLL